MCDDVLRRDRIVELPPPVAAYLDPVLASTLASAPRPLVLLLHLTGRFTLHEPSVESLALTLYAPAVSLRRHAADGDAAIPGAGLDNAPHVVVRTHSSQESGNPGRRIGRLGLRPGRSRTALGALAVSIFETGLRGPVRSRARR